MEKNKQMIKSELLETIDRYYKEYPNIPPMGVSEEEIDSLLNIVEAHFLVHQIMDSYDSAINIIIRRALYYATVDNRDAFIINHLVRSLNDLSVFHIPSDEIKAMQSELLEKSFNMVKKNYTK